LNFSIRIELHGGRAEDYAALHVAMEKCGFRRYVVADDGRAFALPIAEYAGTFNATIKDVTDTAGVAAASTGRPYSVLVAEAQQQMWVGLQQIA